jgi:nitroreductase
VDVYEAVQSRRSVRRFTSRPVPEETLQRVLRTALQSPSGGNLQPWHIYVVAGAALEELKARVRQRVPLCQTPVRHEAEVNLCSE